MFGFLISIYRKFLWYIIFLLREINLIIMNTKERIIEKSLTLFSKRGYNAVTVRDIASAVGIKASSLYNHFENKQNIFNTIVDKYTTINESFFDSLNQSDYLNSLFDFEHNCISNVKLTELSLRIYNFFSNDNHIVKFRQMLTIEKYQNSKLSKLYTKIFIDDILNYHSRFFQTLIDIKYIKTNADPRLLAIEFYSPLFLLINKLDTSQELKQHFLKNHISTFTNTYLLKG